ncbi:MAG: PAS domain S-box protein [Betaproteobacteria bacterium]|nr:PAS domain S-box protein [Betaproteobacteria bacterium]
MNNLNADQHRRVLVIDDSRSIHDDFRKILSPGKTTRPALDAVETALFEIPTNTDRQIQCEVDSAFQGREGVTLVKNALQQGRPYAMAFVDVRMPPGWDGVETTHEIWNIDPNIQIVICTAYSDYSWNEMVAKLGHSDRMIILKKPFDIIEVLQLATALTEKWRLLWQARSTMQDLERRIARRTSELSLTNHKLETEVVEHKLAETKVLESRRWFHTVFQESPIPIFVIRVVDGRIRDVNKSALALYGYRDEEMVGYQMAELDLWEDREKFTEILTILKEDRRILNHECQQRNRAGQSLDVLISCETEVMGGEKVYIAQVVNITDRKRAETRVRQLNRELERRVERRTAELRETVAELDSFTYSVAHDLRAPLRRLQGYLHMITAEYGDGLSAKGRHFLQRIAMNAVDMGALMDGLLKLAHLGRREVDRQPVNMTELMRESVAAAQGEASTNLRFVVGELPTVTGDPVLLKQVWNNLIDNAVKFSQHAVQPTITIDWKRENGWVWFSVADNGVGFDSAYADKLFGVFQRLHNRSQFDGTGVGLSIVRRIAYKHGGTVWAESRLSEGACIYFFLPDAGI